MTEGKLHNAKKSILWGVLIIFALIVSLIVLNEYFLSVVESPINDTVLNPQSVTLNDLHASEDEILNSYKLLDSATGQYRIPIDRAIALVVEEEFQASEER